MSPPRRRVRLLRPALFVGLLLVLASLGIWWTWPDSWTPEAPLAADAERVRADPRPRWVRSPRAPRLRVQAPPASRVAVEPDDEEERTDDTGSEAFGPATITGWLVDSRGRDVGEGSVRARCTLVGEDGDLIGEAGSTGTGTDENGYFELSVTGPAFCEVSGVRRDGLLNALSKPVELWIEPDEELGIDLIVRAERTGGIGISFRPSDEGARVVQVHENTPAWGAGIRNGDLIVAIDGEPTADMEDRDFVSRMTGPEGTDVVFTVRYEEDGELVEETHRAERRYLDRDLIR